MTSKWIKENYKQITSSKVMLRKGHSSIAYSDGQNAEKRIYNIIKQAKDKSVLSNELFDQCKDWPSIYHLSSSRSNLLRPFTNFLKHKNVFELGCGCGAITRFLGECDANVTAIEGSYLRASIAAERCADLANVVVLSDNILSLPNIKTKYDIVTLIGVLEYARMFSTSKTPTLDLLKKAYSLLKPDGCLILAIENRFGLKYFAGANEDHLGRPMAGIQDEYTKSSPVTFSRKILEKKLHEAQFSSFELHLPFPDYKLPSLILHSEGIDSDDFSTSSLLEEAFVRDIFSSQYNLFSLQAASKGIEEAGLLRDLSNSFLYVVWKDKKLSTIPSNELARYYGARNPSKFSKEILFKRKKGAIKVIRKRLIPVVPEMKKKFFHILEDEDYISAQTIQSNINSIINTSGWNINDLAQAFYPWLTKLNSLTTRDGDNKILSGKWFDLTPNNTIQLNNEIYAIDQEWRLDEKIFLPFEFLVFRGLYFSLTRLNSIASPRQQTPTKIIDICILIMEIYNIPFDFQKIKKFWKHQNDLESQILSRETHIPFSQALQQRLNTRTTYNQLKRNIDILTTTNNDLLLKLKNSENKKITAEKKIRALENSIKKLEKNYQQLHQKYSIQ